MYNFKSLWDQAYVLVRRTYEITRFAIIAFQTTYEKCDFSAAAAEQDNSNTPTNNFVHLQAIALYWKQTQIKSIQRVY